MTVRLVRSGKLTHDSPMNRCSNCSAAMAEPDDLTAIAISCGYCGHTQPIANLAERQRLALEQQREKRIVYEAQESDARQAAQRAQQAADRKIADKESKRSQRGTMIITMFTMLIAPVIISITVFDLPARLGFGDSGADRLELISAQMKQTGCSVIAPLQSQYTKSNVSRLFAVENQCVRAMAAGGGDHSTLGLRLYTADGKEVAKADDTTDPQVTYCAKNSATLRLEVRVGPASNGRLSHLVLACPAESAAPPAVDNKKKSK
jgi:DNA-directed RNA polymerase subunit M/transcription elongation factor TFIIS